VINVRTAKALALPPSLILRATVIDQRQHTDRTWPRRS
jgi:hypothetical protein